MPKFAVPPKSLEQVAEDVGLYAADAYYFVQEGLTAVAHKLHGPKHQRQKRHITGQDLSLGLRDLAILQWGMLARTVLERWGVVSTMDFGRIVYSLIDAGLMSKNDDDSLEDFRLVYDFRKEFDGAYKINIQQLVKA